MGAGKFHMVILISSCQYYTVNDDASRQTQIALKKGWSVSVCDGDAAKMSRGELRVMRREVFLVKCGGSVTCV